MGIYYRGNGPGAEDTKIKDTGTKGLYMSSVITNLILTTTLKGGRYYYYLHFIDEETEAWRLGSLLLSYS